MDTLTLIPGRLAQFLHKLNDERSRSCRRGDQRDALLEGGLLGTEAVAVAAEFALSVMPDAPGSRPC